MTEHSSAVAVNSADSTPIRCLSAVPTPLRAPPAGVAPGVGILDIPPIYLVAAAIVLGDAAGVSLMGAPLWLSLAVVLIAVLLYLLRGARTGMAIGLIALAAAASLPARQAVTPLFTRDSLRRYPDGGAITIEGWIARPSQLYPDREYAFVRVDRAGHDGANLQSASGLVRLTIVGGRKRLALGDEVRVAGALRFPRNFGNPGEFDYAGYMARQGIAATMVLNANRGVRLEIMAHRREFPFSELDAARGRIGRLIDANLTGDRRAEMRALIIGDRSSIGEPLRQRFALTGLAHVLVISGLHLGFVAAAAFGLMRTLMMVFPGWTALGYANKAAALAAALAASAYAAIAMPHVSTVRALVMVLAYALAILVDRARALLASLGLAAIVICIAMPGSTADIGFQLSFVSVLAIVLGMRRFAPWWRGRFAVRSPAEHTPSRMGRVGAAAAGYVAVSFWALLGVAPLTARHFNQFSVVGIVANAICVPIIAIGGVICGLVGCAIGMTAPSLGGPILVVAGWSLAAGTWLAGWFARWPAAYFRIFTPTALEIILAYSIILLWLTRELTRDPLTPLVSPRARIPWRWRGLACVVLLAVIAADAGWWIHDRWYHRGLRVTFLSVGEGDSAVVRFADGRVMLIDAGGAWPGGFDFGERVVARYLWSQKIMRVDYLAVSHPDLDHFGGMGFIARNFAAREFWIPGVAKPEASYVALLAEVAAGKIPIRVIDSSMRPLDIGDVTVECLGPAPGEIERKDNNLSMVLRISEGSRSALFTGDVEIAGERELLAHAPRSMLAATVLKAPHHGSRTSSSPAFVSAVRPRIVVLSLGYRNLFGFPAPEVVDRYERAGARVFRTDRSGAVSIDLGTEPVYVRPYVITDAAASVRADQASQPGGEQRRDYPSRENVQPQVPSKKPAGGTAHPATRTVARVRPPV
jgi:competence protein ComEC